MAAMIAKEARHRRHHRGEKQKPPDYATTGGFRLRVRQPDRGMWGDGGNVRVGLRSIWGAAEAFATPA